MIGFLSGKIFEVDGNEIIVDVQGVGYRVRVIDNQDSRFSIQDSRDVSLYTHTYVRESEISLYGFDSKKQLKFFELLIGVSGVGPKMAMNILRQGTPEQIQQAVVQADVSFFTKVSGIGKKNGQRIIVDLKSKLGSVAELDLSEPESGSDDVFDALVSMGFDPKRVQKELQSIDASLGEQERIKQAIKSLSS